MVCSMPRLRSCVRIPLLLAGLVLASPAAGKDCGRLPKGKNPTPAELNEEIAKLSATTNVPSEIIKGVAWQESGCQQWRANGTFVYNKKDCGLGMMQLTGATARQFDIDRLKDDWKYNLACGIKVLTQKWARAQRRGQVPADPAARRVLENWYYPVAYYWGGKVESYLRKIFRHIERRPGRLAKLLGRSVKVTIASEVIPGFKFGDTFTALPKNRFKDKDGKIHKAPTHLGTIGDPKTMAALDTWLARGRKAASKGKVRLALKYLIRVTNANLDTSHKAEAKKLLEPLIAEAEARLKKAAELAKAGDSANALKLLRKVARDYKGHAVSKKAKQAVAQLKKKLKKKKKKA